MKKYLIAFVAILVLCVPAFAENEVYFTPLPSSFTNVNNNNHYVFSSSDNIYGYYQYSDSFNRDFGFYCCSSSSSGSVDVTKNGSHYDDLSLSPVVNVNDFYITSGYSVPSGSTIDPEIDIVPYSWSNADIASAFSDYLANLPTPTPDGSPVTVHVPYGNVLYIKVDQRQEDIQLVAHMPKLSFLIPDRNYGYWGETGICWGDYNTLPYSGLTFPLQGMSGIDWQRDSSRNILGQTKTGVATKIMNTGVWYALFCPSLFGHFDLDSSSALPGASVDVTGVFSDIRLYPLSDSYSFVDNEVINGSDSEYQDFLDGEPTESGTVTWTDQDGNVSTPRAGGSSYVPEAESAESLVSQIKNILGNIVKELQTLFTFGYDAIQTLVNLMSDFVSGFSQLYTWLPAPVYSALIAAVTVAIVIGVFKVFL